jgi:hypothetical protein
MEVVDRIEDLLSMEVDEVVNIVGADLHSKEEEEGHNIEEEHSLARAAADPNSRKLPKEEVEEEVGSIGKELLLSIEVDRIGGEELLNSDVDDSFVEVGVLCIEVVYNVCEAELLCKEGEEGHHVIEEEHSLASTTAEPNTRKLPKEEDEEVVSSVGKELLLSTEVVDRKVGE